MTHATGKPTALFPRLITADQRNPGADVLDAEVGAMPLAFGTAHNLLVRAQVVSGTSVLVIFAGQAVGYAAVRLATIRGANTSALCPASAAALVRAAGGQLVSEADLDEAGAYDAVIDLTGDPDWRRYLDLLKPGGFYARSGAIPEPPRSHEARQIFLNDLTQFDRPHRAREVFAGLVTVVAAPHLRLMPTKTK